MPTDSQRRQQASAHHAEVQGLTEKLAYANEVIDQRNAMLTAANAKIAQLEAIESAARNLVKVKGRYHTEQAFKALASAIASKQEPA